MVYKILVLAFLLTAVQFGYSMRCYHCYDLFNKTSVSDEFLRSWSFGDKLVRCDKDRKQWNFWDCPQEWPVCVITSAKVDDHFEVVRSCAVDGFCSKMIPPNGTKMEYCHECKTTLCNDYPPLPDFPDNSGPLFVFNININLRVKNITALVHKKHE